MRNTNMANRLLCNSSACLIWTARSNIMNRTVPVFWSYWLLGLTLLLTIYGLAMAFAPRWMNDVFAGPLLYHSEVLRSAFTSMTEPESTFHNVFDGLLGAVTIGYAILIGWITFKPFRRGERWAWNALGMSVIAWAIVEAYVKLSGGLGIWSMAHIGF